MDCSICSGSFDSRRELSLHTEYWQQQIQYHLRALAQCFRHQAIPSKPKTVTTTVDQPLKTSLGITVSKSVEDSLPTEATNSDSSSITTSNTIRRHGVAYKRRRRRSALSNKCSPNLSVESTGNYPTRNDPSRLIETFGVPSQADVLPASDNLPFPCTYIGCEKQLRTIWEWRRHYGTHVKINLSCPACNKLFTRASHILNHRCSTSTEDPLCSQRQNISKWLDILRHRGGDATEARKRLTSPPQVDQSRLLPRNTNGYNVVAIEPQSPFSMQSVPVTSVGPWDCQESLTDTSTQHALDQLHELAMPCPELVQSQVSTSELSPSTILKDGSVAPGIWDYRTPLFMAPCIRDGWVGATDPMMDQMTAASDVGHL